MQIGADSLNYDNTYIKINLDAISGNLAAIRRKVGTAVMAVVKADAYGHGAVQIARSIQDQCAMLGVSSMQEAQELRHAGIHAPILILGQTPVAAFRTAVREDVRLTVFSYEDALRLSEEARKQNKEAVIHLAVDTGMSRIGMQASEESAQICAAIAALPGIRVEGLFSHFATADGEDLTQARSQAALFEDFCQKVKSLGIEIPMLHMDNSAGLMNFDRHYDLVRAGIVLYGMYPSSAVDAASLPLEPAMEWLSRVSHVKTLPAGRSISYGAAFTTTRQTRVATVSTGYADGYCRSLSGKFHVLIRGKKAPILGKVCMDQMMVDVTDIPDVAPEDPVVLVGKSGDEQITVDQIAAAADTFHYEFVCGINRRVPRVYYREGRQIDSVHYLLDYLLE